VPPKKRTPVHLVTSLPPSGTKRKQRQTAPRRTAAQLAILANSILKLVAAGYTIAEAADELKLSRPQASKLYADEMARSIEENTAVRDTLVMSTLETLRQLKKAHMHDATVLRDEKSARIVLGVVDREMDLLGLKQAIQVQISNQKIDTTVGDVVKLIETTDANLPKLLESDVFIVDARPDESEQAG
jgi:hypothetical protein